MPDRRVSASPRRGRDAAATREAILEAATRRFATEGYQRAGAREIAADAGVTAALVNRYFGSKQKLFAEVIERALDMRHLLQDQRGGLAEHLARVVVHGQEGAPGRVSTPLLLLLSSATEPDAVRLFRRDLDRTAIPLLAERIGGEDAAVRAAMVMAQLTGFAIMQLVHRPKALAKARGEELEALLSKTLAVCIGSDLASAGSAPDADGARPHVASSSSPQFPGAPGSAGT